MAVSAARAGSAAEAGATVLALNSGSSSLKFGLYRVDVGGVDPLLSGEASAIGTPQARFQVAQGPGREARTEAVLLPDVEAAVACIGKVLDTSGLPPPDAIGHRIVHGGPTLRMHCILDAAVVAALEAATSFAPLHLPAALSVIHFAQAHFPGVPQVACFDTAFHAGMPDVARTLPLPLALRAQGIQRYGFHGLSCESILHQLGRDVPDRIVIAHLGNGASVTAVKAGCSVDTSMGLTPAGGVVMGTRSGDLDPGVLVWLLRQKHLDAAAVEALVNQQSGLAGISGIGGDMRLLHAAASANPDARLAIDLFCQSVRKQVAAMIAVLDGVDLVVFTGGIGENDAAVRAGICTGLRWMGVSLDEDRNRARGDPISGQASRVVVRVLPSREDDEIARHAWGLVSLSHRECVGE